jgi:hypothetical protein
MGTMPEATAAAVPPLEPPGVTLASHGFSVGPYKTGSVEMDQPFSGAFDLPTSTSPAALIRLTTVLSAVAT